MFGPLSPRLLVLWSITAATIACILIGGGVWVHHYSASWAGKTLPGVEIGDLGVGGLTQTELERLLERHVEQKLLEGATITVGETQVTVPLSYVQGDNIQDTLQVDVAAFASHLLEIGKRSPVETTFYALWNRHMNRRLSVDEVLEIEVDTTTLHKELQRLFPNQEIPAQNARFALKNDASGLHVEIVPEQGGREFDLIQIKTALIDSFWKKEQPTLRATLKDVSPSLTTQHLVYHIDAVEKLVREPSDLIAYQDRTGKTQTVEFNPEERLALLEPNNHVLQLHTDALIAHLELKNVRSEVEQTAENARFQIVNGRVEEFLASRPGTAIDSENTGTAFEQALFTPGQQTVQLALQETQPLVSTSSVNTLGIKEIIGVGQSSYKGSPANRIKNIKNGARQLNGRLIAPGETFSLNAALAPFTIENGYFPELVIKGDKILPEIGGGLCQVGTTAFRATMHAGLDVVERRNHSLVVSYYNDPSNNNPGTDATIYDPVLDYKFKNTTAHHILFQAEALEATQELKFTLWGTSDGRIGSYTPPVVERWIPTGPDRETVSDTLAPGERKCQGAHPGAITSFLYEIIMPDGAKTQREFRSNYRPLPKICLIGPTLPETSSTPLSSSPSLE